MGKKNQITGELVAFQPTGEVTVLPPQSGIVGKFLDDTANMFKARAMRMSGLLSRINESGQRTEGLLRTAAERMEAAEAHLAEDLLKQGLLPENEKTDDSVE
jgi:hypothetical protein